MSVVVQESTAPMFKYNSLLIGSALRVIAKKNKRPEAYPVSVCRDVFEAIKNDTDHKLKSEVLGVLHHSPFADGIDRIMTNNLIESFEDTHSQDDQAKIDYIKAWCLQRRGRYNFIAKTLRINLSNLQMRLNYKMKMPKGDLRRIHDLVQHEIQKETKGANPKFGSHDNEKFFVWLLKVNVQAMMDLACKHITKLNITDSEAEYSAAAREWVSLEDRVGPYKPCDRLAISRLLEAKELLSLSIDANNGAKKFRLSNQRYQSEFYKLAFEEVKMLHAAGCINKRYKFSKTENGQHLTKKLLNLAYSYYDVSEKYRQA